MGKIEIINKSLTLIGAAPITSLTDASNMARIESRVYDLSLRSILSECPWNFAMKRKLLATSTATLDWYDTGVTVVYQRPSDIIRIFGTNDNKAIWQDEGDYIVSDTAGLGIRYVQYLDVPSKYTASFTDAFIDKLAADCAFMILNSATIAAKYLEKYEKLTLPKAMAENSQGGTQPGMEDNAWIDARDTGAAGV